MSQEIISENTQNCLALLNEGEILKNFYLAGGTGLAFQLNHRISIDLDFLLQENLTPKN